MSLSQGSDGLAKGLLNWNVQCHMLLHLIYYKLLRLVEIAPRDNLFILLYAITPPPPNNSPLTRFYPLLHGKYPYPFWPESN